MGVPNFIVYCTLIAVLVVLCVYYCGYPNAATLLAVSISVLLFTLVYLYDDSGGREVPVVDTNDTTDNLKIDGMYIGMVIFNSLDMV